MSHKTNAVTKASVHRRYNQFLETQSPRFLRTSANDGVMPHHKDWQHAAYVLHPALGNGWTDMHAFDNGIMVARMHCHFAQEMQDVYQNLPDNLRLGLVLSGHCQTLDVAGRHLVGEVGDVVVRNADPGTLRRGVRKGDQQVGVCIDIPRAMVHALRGQGVDIGFAGPPNSCTVLKPAQSLSTALRQLGQRMLAVQTQHSLLGRLELESLSLALLLKLVQACASPPQKLGNGMHRRWQKAVDEVLDILHAQWDRPHTIAALAHRAGINECYLKMLFRQRTGQTIAVYLRHLRMQHAREMLARGHHSITQIARHCGYARADKFAQAFQRAYGVLPSSLQRLPR